MSQTNWNQFFGWTQEQIEDLRLVGYSYVKQGKYSIALPIFKSLTTLNLSSVYDLQTLGAIHLELGNFLEALNALEKALTLDPSHEATLLNRIKALFSLGYKRQATAQALSLKLASNAQIANQAAALLLAYS